MYKWKRGPLESIKHMVAREWEWDCATGLHQARRGSGELVAKTIPEFGEERSLWLVYRHTIMLPPACAAFIKVTQSELIHRKEKPAKH